MSKFIKINNAVTIDRNGNEETFEFLLIDLASVSSVILGESILNVCLKSGGAYGFRVDKHPKLVAFFADTLPEGGENLSAIDLSETEKTMPEK